MSPCARCCGRAVSSSWKLPPRGARRARPGGGERRGRARPLSQGKAPPPPPPRGEGGEVREGEGRERHGNRGSGFPPHPPLNNNGFPLLPPAAHSAPRPLSGPARGFRGAAAAGAVGTRADTYKN